jgi:hypothetical protein
MGNMVSMNPYAGQTCAEFREEGARNLKEIKKMLMSTCR